MHLTLNFKSNSCQLTELSSVFLVFASFHGEVCPVSSAVSRRPLRHTTWPQPGHWERTVLCRLPHFKIKSSSQTNLRPSEEVAKQTLEFTRFTLVHINGCQLSSRRETFQFDGFSMSYFLFEEPPFIPELHCAQAESLALARSWVSDPATKTSKIGFV